MRAELGTEGGGWDEDGGGIQEVLHCPLLLDYEEEGGGTHRATKPGKTKVPGRL